MITIHKLLKSQKNDVFRTLQAAGLEPANFSWIDKSKVPNTGRAVPKLEYLDGGYYFQFDMLHGDHSCTFSPGIEKIIYRERTVNWQNQMSCVADWIHCLKRETEAPDLWQEMEKYKTSMSLALPEQLLNEPISTSEANEIANKVHLLADKIEELFQLTAEQNRFVRNKLNYLADTAKRQRSVDWVHTSIGVFITIAMALSLPPDRAKELWQLIESVLGGFIHLISS